MIFLDTDITIGIFRKLPPALTWLHALDPEEDCGLSGFVVMELVQGRFNKRDIKKVQDFVRPFAVLWPSSDVCDTALSVYSSGRLTHNLGLIDALIGQHAVALNLTLLTFNKKHFAAIPGLRTTQPYVR